MTKKKATKPAPLMGTAPTMKQAKFPLILPIHQKHLDLSTLDSKKCSITVSDDIVTGRKMIVLNEIK